MTHRYLFTLSRIQNRILGHIRTALSEAGLSLSPGQMGILLALENQLDSGPVSMGDLSRILEMDGAALTRLSDGLCKKDFLCRNINPENRRQVLLLLTDTGREAAGILKTIVRAANQRIEDGFTEADMAVYNRINQAILEKFSR